ncbi:MAG: hypothetical protein LBH85_10370, partial [Treponema sp.]|nr:hypothetical protein [Treponema sp.]
MNSAAQETPLPHNVILSDDVVQLAGAHTVGKGACGAIRRAEKLVQRDASVFGVPDVVSVGPE